MAPQQPTPAAWKPQRDPWSAVPKETLRGLWYNGGYIYFEDDDFWETVTNDTKRSVAEARELALTWFQEHNPAIDFNPELVRWAWDGSALMLQLEYDGEDTGFYFIAEEACNNEVSRP
jgi:hypothetical protein